MALGIAAGILGLMGANIGRDRYQQYRAGEDQAAMNEGVQGLMGSANQPFMMDASMQFEPGEQIPGLETEGSGLMGGAGQFDAGNQARFAGGLMQLPGGMQTGVNMLQDIWGRDDAMQRQQNALDAAQLQEQTQAMGNYGFDTQAQANTAINQLQAQHDKQTLPLRSALNKYEDAMQVYNDAGGDVSKINGVGDITLARTFIKLLNGGQEAFMSDDQQAVQLGSMGIGSVESFLNMLSGKGQLDGPAREKLLGGISNMAQKIHGQLGDERALASNKLNQYGIPQNLIMRPEMVTPVAQEFNKGKRDKQAAQSRMRAAQTSHLKTGGPAMRPPPPGVTFVDIVETDQPSRPDRQWLAKKRSKAKRAASRKARRAKRGEDR